MKILFAEDNEDSRMIFKKVLEHEGYAVAVADNGAEALMLARQSRPDLIISDILMPEMDGFSLCRAVKEDEHLCRIPFIFYTATYVDPEDEKLGLSLGANRYVMKPKEMPDLLEIIEEVIREQKSRSLAVPEKPLADADMLDRMHGKSVSRKLNKKMKELEEERNKLQLSEKKYRRLVEEWEKTFEAIGDIVIIQDTDMRIVRANRAALETLQLDDEDLEGRHCYEVFRNAAEACENCPVQQTLQDLKGHSAEIQHRNLNKILLVSSAPLFDDKVDCVGIVHSARDITENKKMESRLRQSQKMEAIGTLAGGIAHDFNNILSAILGYAELAQMQASEKSPLAAHLAAVLKAGDRAKELVNQILTFSRQTESERKPIEIHLIVKEALKLLRASIPTTIEFRKKINLDCGLVLGDPTQIHQVVMNLCTNAYQAMQEKGGILGIAVNPMAIDIKDSKNGAHTLPPGPYIKLEVSDTGAGMDRATQERIFDPYFTTKEKGKGTGLGLAVVHGIVKDHGGHISAYSEPGKGSTFHVYFPRIKSAHEPLEAAATEPLPGGKEHILLVDDEETIVNTGKELLETLGYTVTPVLDSREALRMFQAQPELYDLLITDMSMPHMTGVELARKALGIKPALPIILCTGFSELITAETAKEIGIRKFLMKPVLRRDMANAVREALDERGEG